MPKGKTSFTGDVYRKRKGNWFEFYCNICSPYSGPYGQTGMMEHLRKQHKHYSPRSAMTQAIEIKARVQIMEKP